jgi:hypothetical protein
MPRFPSPPYFVVFVSFFCFLLRALSGLGVVLARLLHVNSDIGAPVLQPASTFSLLFPFFCFLVLPSCLSLCFSQSLAGMDQPMDATSALEWRLLELERKIERVEVEIDEVVAQLKPLEKKALKDRDEEEKEEIKHLRKKEEQLREEKKQLREKEKQLREGVMRTDSLVLQKLDELSVKVDATSQEVRATSQEVRATSQEMRATSQKVDRLGRPEVSMSTTQLGRLTLEQVEANSPDEAGDAVLSAEDAQTLAGIGNETALVQYLLPILRKFVPDGMALVNSENHQWIETLDGIAAENRKPDLFLCPKSFWQQKGEDNRGVLARWKLKDSVSVLCEAKTRNLHETVGQIVTNIRHLCHGEFQMTRFGIALLPSQFYVLEFSGMSVINVTRSDWGQRGGNQLLARAFGSSTHWSTACVSLCSLLHVSAVGEGRGFLGAGGFGRVIRCHVGDEEKALKMVVGDHLQVVAAMREFEALQKAKRDCPDNVMQVFKCMGAIPLEGSVYMGGYTMTLGEPVDVTSLRARSGIFEALRCLHAAGWCHGDARAANVVKVGRNYQWIDFMTASHDPRKEQVERDVQMLIKSIYARVQKISSPDVKLPLVVIKAVEVYAHHFEGADGQRYMSDIVSQCEIHLGGAR